MDKEERNRVIDEYLAKDFHVIEKGSTYKEAIRECDKLARAWDKLQQIVLTRHATSTILEIQEGYSRALKYVERQMDALDNPTPKDPLEELEGFVKGHESMAIAGVHGAKLITQSILAEIRRLRGKKPDWCWKHNRDGNCEKFKARKK